MYQLFNNISHYICIILFPFKINFIFFIFNISYNRLSRKFEIFKNNPNRLKVFYKNLHRYNYSFFTRHEHAAMYCLVVNRMNIDENSYSLANVARATLPIKAVLYEITTRFAEEAMANWSTAKTTRITKRAEAPAAANPAIHTATEIKEKSAIVIPLRSIVIPHSLGFLSRYFQRC